MSETDIQMSMDHAAEMLTRTATIPERLDDRKSALAAAAEQGRAYWRVVLCTTPGNQAQGTFKRSFTVKWNH